MSEESPSRSRLIALREEQRAMQEGYVFLDEKCLLLAGAMLRELRRHDALAAELAAAQQRAAQALAAALARHGLDGLSVYPAERPEGLTLALTRATLIGVALRQAELHAAAESTAAAAVFPSPEAEACRLAFRALAEASAPLAAVVGNLTRLHREYRRTVRRACALHDVVLPELAQAATAMAGQLEELERDEALWVRISRRG